MIYFLQSPAQTPSQAVKDQVWTFVDVLQTSINNLLRSGTNRLPFIAAGLVVLLVFWILAGLVKSVFWSASGRTRLDSRLRILFSRLLSVATIVLGIFTALTVIIPSFGFGDLITGLGFTSFVIGFATKDILNNLLSGVLILWQQPFRIGDYLFVGNNQGTVQYIGVRATTLRKDDGELVLIPNGDMYSSAITIRGAGAERRMVLKIAIGYECDTDVAKDTIYGVLNSTDGVVEDPKPNVVVTDLTADGVNLAIYFWINTDTHKPMVVFDAVTTGIKRGLENAEIEIYPPSSLVVKRTEEELDAIRRRRAPLD